MFHSVMIFDDEAQRCTKHDQTTIISLSTHPVALSLSLSLFLFTYSFLLSLSSSSSSSSSSPVDYNRTTLLTFCLDWIKLTGGPFISSDPSGQGRLCTVFLVIRRRRRQSLSSHNLTRLGKGDYLLSNKLNFEKKKEGKKKKSRTTAMQSVF